MSARGGSGQRGPEVVWCSLNRCQTTLPDSAEKDEGTAGGGDVEGEEEGDGDDDDKEAEAGMEEAKSAGGGGVEDLEDEKKA